MFEFILVGAACFFFGFILGQEFHSKAPHGWCARCGEALRENEGAMCAVCVEAALMDDEDFEWSR